MRSTVAQSVGVDISKDALDVAIHPSGESFRITNNHEGHRALDFAAHEPETYKYVEVYE